MARLELEQGAKQNNNERDGKYSYLRNNDPRTE